MIFLSFNKDKCILNKWSLLEYDVINDIELTNNSIQNILLPVIQNTEFYSSISNIIFITFSQILLFLIVGTILDNLPQEREGKLNGIFYMMKNEVLL